jgi:hypothetical protein
MSGTLDDSVSKKEIIQKNTDSDIQPQPSSLAPLNNPTITYYQSNSSPNVDSNSNSQNNESQSSVKDKQEQDNKDQNSFSKNDEETPKLNFNFEQNSSESQKKSKENEDKDNQLPENNFETKNTTNDKDYNGIEKIPEINNIVSTVELDCKLNLKEIALQVDNVKYNPKKFTGLIMKIREPKATALIFPNGKMVCLGT